MAWTAAARRAASMSVKGGGEGDDFEWLILNFEWQREM